MVKGIMATGETKSTWNEKLNQILKQAGQFDYTISYDGKIDPEQILKNTPKANLKKVWNGKSRKNSNKLFYGNNLNILMSLLDEYRGKVTLIYIDPPFATNKVFNSRSRKNAYQDTLIGWPYIEFMRERLLILKELLAENGSIYVHIDDNMAFELKLIMDEIFGRKNFRNLIVRKKCNPKNYTRKQYGNIADYILFYSNSEEYVWNRPFTEWAPDKLKAEYPYLEETTGRYFKKVPIHAPGIRNGDTGLPWRGIDPPPGKHWQYKRSTLDKLDKEGEIYWSKNGNPRRKIYLDTNKGKAVQDIWLDVKDPHNQNVKITGYPTEKNPLLLERIVEASSNQNDIVLDCFAGSGTTLGAASKLNRKWIGIDSSFEAMESIIKRFTHGLKPMGDFVNQDSKNVKVSLFDEANYLSDLEIYSEEQLIGKKFDKLISSIE